MGPPQSPLERQWRDSVARERRLLAGHPEWTITRHKPDGWPRVPVTFEATDGVVTLRSADLGRVLDLMEHAIAGGG